PLASAGRAPPPPPEAWRLPSPWVASPSPWLQPGLPVLSSRGRVRRLSHILNPQLPTITPVTEWLRLLRVSRAKELMQAEEAPIPRLAFASGFRDVRTFERAFKRFVGVPPGGVQGLCSALVTSVDVG